jgi:hypothetical protein
LLLLLLLVVLPLLLLLLLLVVLELLLLLRNDGSIHVYDDSQKVRGAWAAGGQTGRGAFLLAQGAGQQHGAGLAIGRQHWAEEGRRDLDAFTDRVQEVKDQMIIALGPIQG